MSANSSASGAAGLTYHVERFRPKSSHCRRMLKPGCLGSIHDRFSSIELGRFFFQPRLLHLQPPDLLVKVGDERRLVL